MEEVNEIKRYLLTIVKSTKKKDINVTSKVGCNQSLLIKNRWKKKLSGRYERHCWIVEKIEIKTWVINDYKQKKSHRISSIRSIKCFTVKIKGCDSKS